MRIFFTLISVLVFHTCLAQTAEQKIGYANNLEAYVGTWQFTFASDTFRIALRKGISSTTSYCETLLGGYRYVKNGVLIGDYLSNGFPAQFLRKDYSITDNSITIMASNASFFPDLVPPPDELLVFFKDMGLGKTTCGGWIQLLSPTQIRWRLADDEEMYDSEEEEEEAIRGFSVPTDVILKKISDDWRPLLDPSNVIPLKPKPKG